MGWPAEYTVLVTNPGGSSVLCDPVEAANPVKGIPGYREIKCGPRRNEVGHGSLTVTALPELLAAVNTPESRMVVIREPDGGGAPSIVQAGPIEKPDHGFQAKRDGTDGYGVVTVNFACDKVRLGDRLLFPNPAQLLTAQTIAKYAVAAGNAEDAMRAMVNTQAGPGALAERRLPGLVLGTDRGLAATVPATSFTRNQHVLEGLRKLVELAGDTLLFDIVPANNQLLFEVYQPADLSASIFFSRDLGNIEEHNYAPEAPLNTVAYVGDSQAGVGRVIRRRQNAAALAAGWLVKETFVDARSAANATEMDQEADKELADTGPKNTFTLVGKDTVTQRFGYDYPIGAKVSAEPYEGVIVSALVQGADITVTPKSGEEVVPIIGVGAASDSLADAKATEIRKILKRLAVLEAL